MALVLCFTTVIVNNSFASRYLQQNQDDTNSASSARISMQRWGATDSSTESRRRPNGGLVKEARLFYEGSRKLRLLMEKQHKIVKEALENVGVSLSMFMVNNPLLKSFQKVTNALLEDPRENVALLGHDTDNPELQAMLDKLTINMVANLKNSSLKKIEGKELALIDALKESILLQCFLNSN